MSRQPKPSSWLATATQFDSQPKAAASAPRASSGLLFFFDKCAADGRTDPGDGSCVERIALGGTSQGDGSMPDGVDTMHGDNGDLAPSTRRRVVEMPEAAGDARLQRRRIIAPPQHIGVVIGFQHQGLAAGEHFLDVRRRTAGVSQHAQSPRAIREHVLHRLARVVRNGERMHLQVPDRELGLAANQRNLDRCPGVRNLLDKKYQWWSGYPARGMDFSITAKARI